MEKENNLSHYRAIKKCPNCGIENEKKKTGPFARKKLEGMPSYKVKSEIYYYCFDCKHSWTEFI